MPACVVQLTCADQTDFCPVGSTCLDSADGPVCKAIDGVTCKTSTGAACEDNICTGDGCTFEDIDECAEKTHNCPRTEWLDTSSHTGQMRQDSTEVWVYCENTLGGFECKRKVIDDDNCEEDEEGKIIVDYANGWKYLGSADTTNGIVNSLNEGAPCVNYATHKAQGCTVGAKVGSAYFAPYCYTTNEVGTANRWDYCKCKSKFK